MSEYKTRDMKSRLSFKLIYMDGWAQVVYPVDLTFGRKRLRTRPGLDVIDRKRLLSAFEAISANEGALSGRYPHRRNLPTICSNLSRSWAEVKPHHDLFQLGRLETMGPKHAEGMYGKTQLERNSSKWLPMVRLEQTTTPRTRREPTRVAPDRIGSPKGSKPDLSDFICQISFVSTGGGRCVVCEYND